MTVNWEKFIFDAVSVSFAPIPHRKNQKAHSAPESPGPSCCHPLIQQIVKPCYRGADVFRVLRIHIHNAVLNIIKSPVDQVQLTDNFLRRDIQTAELLVANADPLQPDGVLTHLGQPLLDVRLIQIKVVGGLQI